MGLIAKIKEIIFKVKDYDRLESDYCTVLDMVTGGLRRWKLRGKT